MSLGLIWFTLADSTVAPNFNLTGEEPWAHLTSLSALGEELRFWKYLQSHLALGSASD